MVLAEIKSYLTDPAQVWIDKLANREPPPPLVPGGDWDSYLTSEIAAASPVEIFNKVPSNLELALSFQSGLLLWNDALDASHSLSQNLPSETGSYWHGIMHRREPDFGNSKYWFRKVGVHPAFETLSKATILVLQEFGDGYAQTLKSEIEVKGWDPFDFVDRCEKASGSREAPEVVDLLERIQEMEIKNLLLWCMNSS